MTAPTPRPSTEAADRLREALAEMAAGTRDLAREAMAVVDHFRPEFNGCRVEGNFPNEGAAIRAARLYPFVIDRDRDARRLTREAETLECAAERLAELTAERDKLRADLNAAVVMVGEHTRVRGEVEGMLRASETVGVVEGWREEVERLRAALRPFAVYAEHMPGRGFGHGEIGEYYHGGVRISIRTRDLEIARALLAQPHAADREGHT